MKQKILITLAIPWLFAASSMASMANALTISGKLVDEQTKEPVVFANVVVNNTSIGTVTNGDGAFVLKVPNEYTNGEIRFSFLGYKDKIVQAGSLNQDFNVVELTPLTINIDQIIVRTMNAQTLIERAKANIPKNYSVSPEMMTAFYRETVKQNNKYVSIAEAVLDIYKSSYKTVTDGDRVKVYKGRKSIDVKRADTVLVKLQGGPRTCLMLDIVREPGDILDAEMWEHYKFVLDGITSFQGKEVYRLNFYQKPTTDFPLYDGTIYIDKESYAITGLEFEFSKINIDKVDDLLIRKLPAGLRINFVSANYLVKYAFDNNVWHLNYVRCEMKFGAKYRKKLFRTNVETTIEMAVTDRSADNIVKFKIKETSKYSDVLSEKVEDLVDTEFWGDYNVIKPEESIEVAIEKLNKKLIRSNKTE